MTGIVQYLKNRCARVAIRNEAGAEVEPLANGSLPDRLINPEEYELPFYTPQEHITAETTEVADEQRRLVTPAVADLEIQKGGFSHWRAKRVRKFLGCHAHFRSRWKSKLNISKQL